jgi:hypothetical protein
MNAKFAKTVITAATLAAALASGFAQAAGPQDSSFAGDKYGYTFRVGMADAFTDGAKTGKFDPYTEGARVGKTDPYTEGFRTVAGLDTRGVSASPARSFNPYTDGARTVAGLDTRGVSQSPARTADPYTDGAKVGKFDPYTDGALA